MRSAVATRGTASASTRSARSAARCADGASGRRVGSRTSPSERWPMADDGGAGMTLLEKVMYEFRCADGPDTDFHVYQMHLLERISEPFELTLDLVTEDIDIDSMLLLGGAAELVMRRGDAHERSIYGIVAEVDYIGLWGSKLLVRVRIVPALALAAQRVNSRMFQDASVQDILTEVLGQALGPYARTADLSALTRGTRVRDYCLQYHEADL